MPLKTYTIWGDEKALGTVNAMNVDNALESGKLLWPGRAKAAWLLIAPWPPQTRTKHVPKTSPTNQELRSEPMFEPRG